MTKPVHIQHHSLGESLGIALFLFGVQRIHEQKHTLVGWAIILGFGEKYWRPEFQVRGIHLPDYPNFWETFLELRNTHSSLKELIDPGLRPDANETEFILRLSTTYALLCMALDRCINAVEIDEARAPIVTPKQEQLLLHKATRGPGPHLKALELYTAGNALVFLCNHWHIVRRPV